MLYTAFAQDHINLRPDLTVDLGLRYDRQTLTDATKNFARALVLAGIRGAMRALRFAAATDVLHADSLQCGRQLFGERAGWIDDLHRNAGQTGFPTCLTGSCLPLNVDPKTLPAFALPARDITIMGGHAFFIPNSVHEYGLDSPSCRTTRMSW
jgi:hypothetical protein